MKPVTDRQLERVVSKTLRRGLFVSGGFMAAGFILYSIRVISGHSAHDFSDASFRALLHQLSFPVLLAHPLTYLYAGILCLALTPVARVIIAIVAFALEGDRRYMWVSTLVLGIILLSIALSALQ